MVKLQFMNRREQQWPVEIRIGGWCSRTLVCGTTRREEVATPGTEIEGAPVYASRLKRHIAAALLFATLLVWPFSWAIAGEGRIDASNGDVYFNVHYRFPPTTQQITDVKAAIDMMSVGVCDATDGQMRVKRVTLSQGEPNEDKGDFWLHALPGRSGLSFFPNGSNLGSLGSHVDMFSGAMLAPDVYLHEFGHHAWGLGDEYDEQRRFGGSCGIGPGFDPGTIDEQNHSIMQQSGGARCVGGLNSGSSCFRNSDCPGAGGGPAGACQFVLMSELSVATNNDPLQGNAPSCPAVTPPAAMCPDNAYCTRAYNTITNRYEQTQQSEMHNDDSDWETLAENYPFITQPIGGLPVAAAPATCSRTVDYQEDVRGSDQVLLVLDRSGSMSWSSNPADGEVCANGVDDDGDGIIDEATCGNARITFVTAAANAYLDLQRDRNVDVGILSFNETPTLNQAIGTLSAGNIATYKGVVAGLVPSGNTGIGDALDATTAEFTRVATLGRSRTAYLMTDGFNTSGVDPVAAAERLRDIGVRVHVIPAGSDVSETQLGGVAATTKGDLLAAPGLSDLTAIYAELAGRHRGAAMALPRLNFELSLRGQSGGENEGATGRLPSRQRAFPIFVEKQAKSLVAFVAGRNARISEWSVGISLIGPNGEIFGPGSPELTVNPFYLFIDVPNPAPGEWKLIASATGPGLQRATALAFIENPNPQTKVVAPPITSGCSSAAVSRPAGRPPAGRFGTGRSWRRPPPVHRDSGRSGRLRADTVRCNRSERPSTAACRSIATNGTAPLPPATPTAGDDPSQTNQPPIGPRTCRSSPGSTTSARKPDTSPPSSRSIQSSTNRSDGGDAIEYERWAT